jgi:hypothetical protein
MGCDSSQSFVEGNKNIITTEENDEEMRSPKKKGENKEEVVNKEGNKENKDNRKNKKDQRKKRDKKNQQEFRMSEKDKSSSSSSSYKIKKKMKKKLKSGKKKKEDSERSDDDEDDNKEDNSNINTEGMNTVETRKLNFKKKENEGLLIMDGVEELIPEELTEDDIYQLVQDALGENIVEKEEDKVPGTITRKQARSIATLLYKKLRKKKGRHEIDISDYPELKGLNIRIGAGQFTKDVIKNMMFNDENVDEREIDKTYAKLAKNANDVKALTIELITDDVDNDKDNKSSKS